MNQEQILKVILGPITSEKTTTLVANNQYVFKVNRTSTKREIKFAIQQLFGVSVEHIQTILVKGKKKVFKNKPGKRSNWKKAIVKVADGQMIDISSF